MKNICCSFDQEHGTVFVTCNNGVHPDRVGHYSNTIVMTRDSFAKALKQRNLFGEALGVEIHMGWQNALKNAISNCIGIKTELEPEVAAKEILAVNVEQRGEEAVAADIAELQKNNEAIQNEIKEIMKKETEPEVKEDGDKPRKTRTTKGSKKSRGATADTTPDANCAGSDSQSE